ncbi:MAG: DUF4112 domain-containing protein [Acidobacteria bacterium]|nr:DUF4112 domain-containing protein [Acidobacteriota bacterium]
MSESLLLYLLGGLLLFVALVAIAYLVVRFAFIRIAERVSAQMAVHIESAVTRAVTQPHIARAGKASAAAGRKIQDLAAARGINVDQAKAVLLARLERTARLMDSEVRLPVVGGIGLDPLLGLIPYAGDVVSATVAGAIILNSLQYGLPKAMVAQMVANMFVDLLFGAIPIVGDLFDIAFKANTRNLALLREHLERRP